MLNHRLKKTSDQNGKQLSNIFDSTSRMNVDTPQNLCLLIQLLLGVDMSSFRSVHCAGTDCEGYTTEIWTEPVI